MGFNRYNKVVQTLIHTSRSTTAYPCSSLCCNQWRRSLMSSSSPLASTDDPKMASFSTIARSSYHVNGGPSYMRGVVFWEPNKPLTFEDFEMPRPKVNEVLIKIKGGVAMAEGGGEQRVVEEGEGFWKNEGKGVTKFKVLVKSDSGQSPIVRSNKIQ